MHTVAHEIEVPLEQLERILLDRAHEEFSGQVEIDVRLRDGIVAFIELRSETTEFQTRKALQSPEWNEIGMRGAPPKVIDREGIIRTFMSKNAGRFRVVSTVRKWVAHFDRGELMKLALTGPDEVRG